MAKNKQTRKLRITTLFLAVIMALSFCMFIFAACTGKTDDDDDKKDDTTKKTDTQTFANANFEYFDDNDGDSLIGTAESWTSAAGSNDNGVTASSSSAKSGIVDTSADWGAYYDAYRDYRYYSDLDDDSDELKDAEYYTDIDNYYDMVGWDIVAAKYAENEKDSEDKTDLTDDEVIDEKKAEIQKAAQDLNPGTRFMQAGKEDEKNGTHVLMLHNYRTNRLGTAQKYTSEAVTVAAGTEVKFSVWVKTSNLSFDEGETVKGNRGAYIEVVNTVGGTAQKSLVVRNIDTSEVTADNGWEQYTFYVKASDYADTTFSVVLGLGRQTVGTNSSSYEYIQGYAFFDDLKYEVVKEGDSTIDAEIESVPETQSLTLDLNRTTAKRIDAATVTDNKFLLDLKDLQPDTFGLTLTTEDLTADESAKDDPYADYGKAVNGVRPSADDRGVTLKDATQIPDAELHKLLDSKGDDVKLSGMKSYSYLTAANGYAKTLVEDFKNIDKLPNGEAIKNGSNNILMLYSSKGAPYTAAFDPKKDSDGTNDNMFTLRENEYMLVSFWVKTSELKGGTGAAVSVVDNDTKTTIGTLDTTTLTGVDLKDDYNNDTSEKKEARKDIFDGWQKCFFFVSNTTDEDLSFSLEFTYGPTSGYADSTAATYVSGYAAFTGFEYAKLTEEQFNIKSTGTYSVAVELTGGENASKTSFDEVSEQDSKKIENDLANASNYKGVYGGSQYVGGEVLDGDQGRANSLGTAGLLNKEYAANYTTTEWFKIINGWYKDGTSAQAKALDPDNWWNTVFGTRSTQPLLIANAAQQAYGYIANSNSTLSSSAYQAVTVRVKLSPGATAHVYLIDATAPDEDESEFGTAKRYTDSLTYNSGVSYRYDKDGNVVNKDPDDKDFNKTANTLFYLQKNGLWTTEKNAKGDLYYANLKNYDKDSEGNLVDSDGDVVYYASTAESEKGSVYYRYKDEDTDKLSVKVKDFSEAGKKLDGAVLMDMTGDKYETALHQEVTNDGDTVSDWQYVRFFVATGNQSKSYRLEVWSGSRDGEIKNPANSFVAFDLVNTSLDADKFDSYIDARLETIMDKIGVNDAEELLEKYRENPEAFMSGEYEGIEGTQLAYFLYSLYDDNDYTSFDENYNDGSNPYSDYKQSEQKDEIAYLKTEFQNDEIGGYKCYDTYVDFGTFERSVASASTGGDDDATEDTATESDQNVWLLVVSIILAVVLIFTLITLLVRRLLANLKKRKPAAHAQSYDNKRKRYIRKLKLEEAEKDAGDDDVLPEDDEISEEEIYKVESESGEQASNNSDSEDKGESESDKKDEE